MNLYCLFRIGKWIGNRQLTGNWVADSLNLSVWNRQLNRQPATKLPVAGSFNLYCLFRIWIGNWQLSCRLPIRLTCLFRIGNRQLSCQLPISWSYIVCFESVSSCWFVELVCFESVTKSATCNWAAGYQLPVADSKRSESSGLPSAGCRFSCRFETNYMLAQVANCRFTCRLPIQIRNRQYMFRFETDKFNESATAQLSVADSVNLYCLFRIWIRNRQLRCRLPIRWTFLFRIGNRQLSGCRFVELVCFDVAGCRFVEVMLYLSYLNPVPGLLNLSVSNS